MFTPGTLGYAAEAERIASLIDWNQTLTETDKTFYRDYLLAEWEVTKKALELAKEDEMSLRKQVVAFAFNKEILSGTERIELANGYEAKAVKKLNYGFIKTSDGKKVDKSRIDEALDKIEQTGPVGALIAERLVKWEPNLSLTEYKQLTPEFKKVIDEVIVTSEGAPTLEIIAPKGS